MEPAWRKLLFHYGDRLNVRYVYGGLVPNWNGFHDRGAGIAKPADVAGHWADVARQFGQPIDPSVWLKDPLSSSYPPSIAAHAVRLLAPDHEGAFLRRVKEAVFLEARNIARLDVLIECAVAEGLDAHQFEVLYTSGVAERAFRGDLEEVQRLGVRGFPTLVAQNRDGLTTMLPGMQRYADLECLVLRLSGLPRADRAPTPRDALATYRRGTTREFAELLDLEDAAAVAPLKANGAHQQPVGGAAWWSVDTR